MEFIVLWTHGVYKQAMDTNIYKFTNRIKCSEKQGFSFTENVHINAEDR